MNGPHDRRGFLRGLVSLPLIGGGVTLIGNPVAAAEPASPDLLATYDEWLFYERRLLLIELSASADERRLREATYPKEAGARDFHLPRYPTSWRDLPQPSTRAAVVLSAVGCDWRAS